MNRICSLLNIQIPIVQAGMIWCSDSNLALAVSEAGAMGVIGAGSMYPQELKHQIQNFKSKSNKSFAVNVPLLYPNIEEHMNIIMEEEVPVVITSAGNPKTWTSILKARGLKVIHVVSTLRFALKAQEAGVDAVIAEGFEAGGHNGREETTTMVLVPLVVSRLRIPVLAAGGIATGSQMAAAFALGAEGVQMGSRFVASVESSAHLKFKQRVIQSEEGETHLVLKKLTPVRLLKNDFYNLVAEAENRGASPDELTSILGRARAKKGMFEGDLIEGELEIGQVASLIDTIKPAAEIVREVYNEYCRVIKKIQL